MKWFKFRSAKPKTETEQPKQQITFHPNIIKRGFSAAKNKPMLDNWSGDYTLSANLLKSQLPTVRKRCLDLYVNEPIVRRSVQMYLHDIVGDGFAFSADVIKDGTVDQTASDQLETEFKRWAETPEFCHTSKQFCFTDLLKQAVQSWAVYGEAFLVITRSAENPYGISLDLIRADMVATDKNSTYRDSKIINGVELKNGIVTGYHVYTQTDINGRPCGTTVRLDAHDVLHLYRPDTVGQTRGTPIYASVANTLKMLSGYRENMLSASLLAATNFGVFSADSDAVFDPATIEDNADSIDTAPISAPESIITPPGWHYDSLSPQFPISNYDSFLGSLYRDIASGLSQSYPALCNELTGVSYSSIRASENVNRRAMADYQSMVVNCILRPLFRGADNWADQYCYRHNVAVAYMDTYRYADQWTGQKFSQIDPQAEASAWQTLVEMGVMTKTQVANALGTDYYANIITMADEKAYADKWLKNNTAKSETENEVATNENNESGTAE